MTDLEKTAAAMTEQDRIEFVKGFFGAVYDHLLTPRTPDFDAADYMDADRDMSAVPLCEPWNNGIPAADWVRSEDWREAGALYFKANAGRLLRELHARVLRSFQD